MGERLVLDLETQREFNEVEGRKPELLGISVVGLYSYETDRYDAYLEADLEKLAPRLQAADLIIGFNIRRFDLPVLGPQTIVEAAAAGVSCIAVEAHTTLLLEKERLLADADAAQLALVGIDPNNVRFSKVVKTV